MKCSVIVPVFNMAAGGKLEYCLNSLMHQTLRDLEIIAVDDASTDGSLEILRRYEADYPERCKVIHYEKNKRQGGAKNEGLKIASGEWIGFLDSDDWVSPDFYERLIKKAEETKADVVGCDYSLVSEHTMEVGKIVQNNTDDQTGICDEAQHRKLVMRPGSMVNKIWSVRIASFYQSAGTLRGVSGKSGGLRLFLSDASWSVLTARMSPAARFLPTPARV